MGVSVGVSDGATVGEAERLAAPGVGGAVVGVAVGVGEADEPATVGVGVAEGLAAPGVGVAVLVTDNPARGSLVWPRPARG